MRQSVPVSNWTNLELCCKKLTFEEKKKYADETFGFNLTCSLKLHSNILLPERILKNTFSINNMFVLHLSGVYYAITADVIIVILWLCAPLKAT